MRNCLSRFRTPAEQTGQLRKNGADGAFRFDEVDWCRLTCVTVVKVRQNFG